MHIFINPTCNYGKGLYKWKKVMSEVLDRDTEISIQDIQTTDAITEQVEKAARAGESIFIAAGGDGTVNLLLNAIMKSSAKEKDCILGAIGLGSSNDFHKPFQIENFINGVPIRMNWKESKTIDVIRITYNDDQHVLQQRYCIINASIGITAKANAVFNYRYPLIQSVQRISVEVAIFISAIQTILFYKNIPCRISIGEQRPVHFDLTNMGIIKSPHFAGNLCYDTFIRPDDGFLGVNLCAEMTKLETIHTLFKLYKKQFQGLPKTYSLKSNTISVSSTEKFALEMDGEVVQTNCAKFELLPKRVRCCS